MKYLLKDTCCKESVNLLTFKGENKGSYSISDKVFSPFCCLLFATAV